jgi:hypothetical protein
LIGAGASPCEESAASAKNCGDQPLGADFRVARHVAVSPTVVAPHIFPREKPIMPVSMYAIAVPAFQKHLAALDAIIDKAEAYAAAKKIDPSVLLSARLYPDMFNVTRQVQGAADFAKATSARLAGVPVPSFPDTETTIAELKQRIAKTLEFLGTLKPTQMEGSEEKQFTIKVGPNEMTFSGQDYLLNFAIPNFYFHCTTAYDILRHNGLEIGKRDFMRRQ